jgi:hypothetical protein
MGPRVKKNDDNHGCPPPPNLPPVTVREEYWINTSKINTEVTNLNIYGSQTDNYKHVSRMNSSQHLDI